MFETIVDIVFWFVLINWGFMFIVSYFVAYILSKFNGIHTYGWYGYVGYIGVEKNSAFSKTFRKHFPQGKNFSFGMMIYFEDQWLFQPKNYDSREFKKLEAHERAHVKQQFYLGTLQWILYSIFHLVYGYKSNPFEVGARKAADRYMESFRK